MLTYLKLYAIMLIVFRAMDALWPGIIARGFHATYLGHVLASQPQWWAARLLYVVFVAGALVLAAATGLDHSLGWLWLRGARFGLGTYAMCDLTNLATIKDWPWIVTAVDLAWGTVLSTRVRGAGFFAGKWLLQAGCSKFTPHPCIRACIPPSCRRMTNDQRPMSDVKSFFVFFHDLL